MLVESNSHVANIINMHLKPSITCADIAGSFRKPELHPGYVQSEEGDRLLQLASSTLVWHSETFTIFGRERVVPRQISWVGDEGLDYRYASRSHVGTGWPKWLKDLADRMATDFDRCDNHVLLNRYRCGSDHMGWHRDDERGVVGDVLVLSLGASRTLRWRTDARGSSQAILLESGSLLQLDGRLYHRLLAAPGQQSERISMTFRQIITAKVSGDVFVS